MTNVLIRNVDHGTMRWLRLRAAENRRSVNAELLDILRVMRADGLAQQHAGSPFADSLRAARALGVRTPASSYTIVRRDRDHR